MKKLKTKEFIRNNHNEMKEYFAQRRVEAFNAHEYMYRMLHDKFEGEEIPEQYDAIMQSVRDDVAFWDRQEQAVYNYGLHILGYGTNNPFYRKPTDDVLNAVEDAGETAVEIYCKHHSY